MPPEAFRLGPNTYEMLTLGDKDAEAVAREYLNSGYTAAACQLVLFGDGGGLLYDGRRMRGVTYDDDSLSVEGSEGAKALAFSRVLRSAYSIEELLAD